MGYLIPGQVLSAQHIIQYLGIPIEHKISISNGLSIRVSNAGNIEPLCNSCSEVRDIKGIISICQGILLKISNSDLKDIATAIVIINHNMGVIISVRNLDSLSDTTILNGSISIEQAVFNFIDDYKILDILNNQYQIQFMGFEDLIQLWNEINSSELIHVFKNRYKPSNYSALSGLDDIAYEYFNLIQYEVKYGS